ncbi:ring-cleaving dioxygenase [Chenggangzhangella methanolivorans]|uniref:Ring-cleaving dioxygenase n=1 Tax=Chenggangzhangella methanolivorans TaxID=1437009 RepID=A0A9E6UMX3_9HYPH|nr:ring-cleaving dioxygenase [Chenggangzhangella methanolivorans]QZO00451.1 ring-cleaving dioxygenase [Chenggangzhangella methanolivorans]
MSGAALHHVTAISGPARRNVGFYTGVLGLRLVKKTVNFDDPGTYHLYYGDAAGRPGSVLTFFPWDHVAPGRIGVGETSQTSFRVPRGSIGWWTQRFVEAAVPHDNPVIRFGETVLAFKDPDGLSLALVGVDGVEAEEAWEGGSVPAEHAIRGFHGVTLLLDKAEATAAVLTNVFGHREVAREDNVVRYDAGGEGYGRFVDLREVGGFLGGRPGGGSVHHIAFRAADDAAQAAMARKLVSEHGLAVTEQKDRNYFRSVYFREPGGVLFEIATDEPGFAFDEPAEHLGEALKLPPFLEALRPRIEERLPELA